MTACKLTVPGFPGFSRMWGFLIMAFSAVLVAVFPGQGKGSGRMIEFTMTVHTGGPHGFIFNSFLYGSIGSGYRDSGMTFGAFNSLMEQVQGKLRLPVIESHGGFE